ncbi:hypothetical protein HDU76_008889 [Blyttiomyces sp. JEL0837]|nr:hypothetical protein HDU76_008889 [Blyttiomyces sp. JEL0837]
MERDYSFFKDLLLKHCIHRPPFSDKIFSFTDLNAITEYVTNTYFRHYLMYKYVFTKKIKLEFTIENPETTPKQSLDNLTLVVPDTAKPAEVAADGSIITTDETAASSATEVAKAPEESTLVEASAAANVNVAATKEQESVQPTAAPVPTEASPVAPVESTIVEPNAEIENSGGKEPEANPQPSKHDQAAAELRSFILATLSPKLEEMKTALMQKITAQEEILTQRLKKLELDEEMNVAGPGADKGKKDPKAKAKK